MRGCRVYLETLGCAKNSIDSQVMMGQLLNDGFKPVSDPQQSDVMVLNTCAFIKRAVDESIDRILALAGFKEGEASRKLIVAGCLSQRYQEQLVREIPEIDAMIGTSDFTSITQCISAVFEGQAADFQKPGRPLYSNRNLRTEEVLAQHGSYAYLKISEGCSNGCAFCNIPRLRGPFQSRAVSSIRQEMERLVAYGVKEINLISQDSSSYGHDLATPVQLTDLIEELLTSVSGEYWLRVFYTYPNHYPQALLHLMNSDQRLVPYADIPFQHINDSVLKAMNRRIRGRDIESLIETALHIRSDLALRSTLIVGFPNETEQAFQELLRFVEKGYFSHLGVFPYYAEDNIASRKLGNPVSEKVKAERRDLLMQAQQRISLEKNRSIIGQKQKVLLEGAYEETDLLLQGRMGTQGPEVDGLVLINEGSGTIGQFHTVEISDAHPYDLVGRIL